MVLGPFLEAFLRISYIHTYPIKSASDFHNSLNMCTFVSPTYWLQRFLVDLFEHRLARSASYVLSHVEDVLENRLTRIVNIFCHRFFEIVIKVLDQNREQLLLSHVCSISLKARLLRSVNFFATDLLEHFEKTGWPELRFFLRDDFFGMLETKDE